MSQLFGVAFSSPAVVPLLIDNTRFLVHTYNGAKGPFKDFLSVQEDRGKVVLAANVRRLLQVKEMDTEDLVRIFMLFDRADILSKIQGCLIVDGENSEINPGSWTVLKSKVTKDQLNKLLSSATDVAFHIPYDIVQKAALLEPSLFDFIGQVLSSIPREPLPTDEYDGEEDDDFIYEPEKFAETLMKDTVAWVCGIHHARRWIIRHKKRLVKIGADPELTLDLYRFCHEGLSSKNLWRAYHEARGGMSLEEAGEKHEAHPGDLKRCVEIFPLEETRDYKRLPEEEDPTS